MNENSVLLLCDLNCDMKCEISIGLVFAERQTIVGLDICFMLLLMAPNVRLH